PIASSFTEKFGCVRNWSLSISRSASRLTRETAGISRGGQGSAARTCRRALPERDLLQPDLAPSLAEVRIDSQGPVNDIEPKSGAQRQQRRTGGPGLWTGGGRILDRRARLTPREAGEDFRKPVPERVSRLDQHQGEVGRRLAMT